MRKKFTKPIVAWAIGMFLVGGGGGGNTTVVEPTQQNDAMKT